YYPYGASLALALELELRTRFKLTLDDYMTALWKKFGIRELPYTVSGLEDVLAGLTDKSFASSFFDKYIRGHESFNYAPLLEKAGYKLTQPGAGKAWLGNLQFRQGNNLTLSSETLIGTPLYDAGLDIDDKILQLDGKAVESLSDLRNTIEQHKPGDKISIQFKHRETTVTTEIVFAQNNAYLVKSFEKENLDVTGEITAFRKSWLEEKIKK
ncbi:MAG TPA: PDZ domain-containing protein, partial [Flavitalea sp.]|nr:PDZ domain-containing protein [Flavitalea sp.]